MNLNWEYINGLISGAGIALVLIAAILLIAKAIKVI